LQRPTRRIKIFVDTNVLVAGIASASGASAAVLDLCEAEVIQMVISRQVLIEGDRTFSAKLSGLVSGFRQFMRNLNPLMVEDPSKMMMDRARTMIDPKDASILAAALEAQVDFLLTLDKRHFLSQSTRSKIPIKVITPSEFLRIFERSCLEDESCRINPRG